MAKPNFWLRGAKGKFAGASLGKGANGYQMREIVTPRNPNTNPQLFQRAVMATIMRAYSAGKEVFDHSYEGVSVGSKCQQKFMRDNLKLLRQELINAQASANPLDSDARVVARGGIAPVSNAYKISEGTIEQTLFALDADKHTWFIQGASDSQITIADWATANGLKQGDIYTICAFINNPDRIIGGITDETTAAGHYVAGTFEFVRFMLKDSVFTNTNLLSSATLSYIFDVDEKSTIQPLIEAIPVTDGIDVAQWREGFTAGASACIRSGKNSPERSSEIMVTFKLQTAADFGIKAPYLIDCWKQSATPLGDSDLLLEGGALGGTQSGGDTPTEPELPIGLYAMSYPDGVDRVQVVVNNINGVRTLVPLLFKNNGDVVTGDFNAPGDATLTFDEGDGSISTLGEYVERYLVGEGASVAVADIIGVGETFASDLESFIGADATLKVEGYKAVRLRVIEPVLYDTYVSELEVPVQENLNFEEFG